MVFMQEKTACHGLHVSGGHYFIVILHYYISVYGTVGRNNLLFQIPEKQGPDVLETKEQWQLGQSTCPCRILIHGRRIRSRVASLNIQYCDPCTHEKEQNHRFRWDDVESAGSMRFVVLSCSTLAPMVRDLPTTTNVMPVAIVTAFIN